MNAPSAKVQVQGQDVRPPLLDLHRALIDSERREYERARGRLPDGEFLAALLEDPDLAWLRPLTGVVGRLDALLEEDGPESARELEACMAQVRALLKPAPAGAQFQRKYAEALQRSPAAVVDHGRTMRALSTNSTKPRT
jgi:hypothetical protein